MALLRVYHQRRNGRNGSPRGRLHDFTMMGLGFVTALIFCTVAFELLNLQFHWTAKRSGVVSGGVQPASVVVEGVHGAAPRTTQQLTGSRLIITSEKTAAGYTVPGQKDLPLLDFTLSPASDGFVHAMTFVLGDLAHPYDLKSLKLMLGDAQVGEVSFFDGKGSFQNLMVKLSANKLLQFSVLGAVSGQAQVGDRLVLKFADDHGIDAVDGDGDAFALTGKESASGQPVSIVHGR